MRVATVGLALALTHALAAGAQHPHVSIRATTAAIEVSGGAGAVAATLSDASGTRLDGLAIEGGVGHTNIVLVAAVKPGARIDVHVPNLTDLNIEGSNGSTVTVRGVTGQLEIVTSNAGIVLERAGGTVLASTSNGSIEGTIETVDTRLPMSFLTSNGRINLEFPGDLKATLRLESDTTPITSEFELTAVGGDPLKRTITRGGRQRTLVVGAVNGGGAQIEARTENEPIVIRRRR